MAANVLSLAQSLTDDQVSTPSRSALAEKLRLVRHDECDACRHKIYPAGSNLTRVVSLPQCGHVFHEECAPPQGQFNGIAQCSACGVGNTTPFNVESPAVTQEDGETFTRVVIERIQSVLNTECPICRFPFEDRCADCIMHDRNVRCAVQFNLCCPHYYHEHCIAQWRRTRDGCPLCLRIWVPLATTDVLAEHQDEINNT